MLEAQQERYRNFVDNIEDGCFEFDLNGKIMFCNDALPRIFGYSYEEFKQVSRWQRHPDIDEAKKTFRMYTDVYKQNLPGKIIEYEILCKDGTIKNFEAAVSLIHDSSGIVIGYRGIGRDITERKKMEIEQEQLREQLSHARRLEAIGTLAGGVAHDFNNLLMGIQGYTSLMLLDTEPGHPHCEQLKAVESHVRSGADLTRQLLGYARGGRYEVRTVNLNNIVDKAAAMFGRTKKELTINREFTARSLECGGRPWSDGAGITESFC